MKKLILVLTFTCGLVAAQAQITESYATRKKLDSMIYSDVREKLVDLAFQHPEVVINEAQMTIAENNLNKAKWGWSNMFFAQFNLNEFTINGSPSAAFWPKYNFGINMPFDIVTRTKAEIKNARENMDITTAMREDTYRKLRAEVLSRFEDYLFHRELYETSSVVVDEAYSAFLSMQEKYKIGDVNDIDYSITFRQFNDAKMRQRENERDMNVSKLEVERLIGVKLEEVLKNYQIQKK
ncbi:MAG TPA: TolC family protein [Chitinophagaceae bacterium]|nr:TolC family protein [Chitinophagaceae bacterium]